MTRLAGGHPSPVRQAPHNVLERGPFRRQFGLARMAVFVPLRFSLVAVKEGITGIPTMIAHKAEVAEERRSWSRAPLARRGFAPRRGNPKIAQWRSHEAPPWVSEFANVPAPCKGNPNGRVPPIGTMPKPLRWATGWRALSGLRDGRGPSIPGRPFALPWAVMALSFQDASQPKEQNPRTEPNGRPNSFEHVRLRLTKTITPRHVVDSAEHIRTETTIKKGVKRSLTYIPP